MTQKTWAYALALFSYIDINIYVSNIYINYCSVIFLLRNTRDAYVPLTNGLQYELHLLYFDTNVAVNTQDHFSTAALFFIEI